MKQFHLGDILTITTDRLVSPRHMEGVYDILNYMTRDNLFTHQLPRASRECKPYLLRQHPQLAGVPVAALDKLIAASRVGPEIPVKLWLESMVSTYGETLPVEPIPADDHDRKDPLTELGDMVGPDRVVVIQPPPTPPT